MAQKTEILSGLKGFFVSKLATKVGTDLSLVIMDATLSDVS